MIRCRRNENENDIEAAQRELAAAKARAEAAERAAAAALAKAEEAARRARQTALAAGRAEARAEAETIDLSELPTENIIPSQFLTTQQPALEGDPDCFYELGCQCGVSPETASAGDTVTVTVEAVNNNEYSAFGVNVRISLPAGLRFVTSIPEIARAPSGAIWNIGRLAPMETALLTVETLCTSAQPGCVEALVRGSCCDRLLENNAARACINTAMIQTADALVELRAPDALVAGECFPLTVCAKNRGPRRCERAAVSLSLPSELCIVEADRAGYDKERFTWNIGNLAAGESVTLTLTAQAKNGGFGSVKAQLTAATPNSNKANNTASVFLRIDDPVSARVSLRLYSQTKSVTERAGFSVFAQVRNEEEARVQQVVAELPLPPAFHLVRVQGDTYDAGLGVWDIGQLMPGEIKLLELYGCASAAGQMVFEGAVGGGFVNTSDHDSDELSIEITSCVRADLSALAVLSELFATVGQTVEARLLLSNAGPSAALKAALLLRLSEGLTLIGPPPAKDTEERFELGDVPAGSSAGVTVLLRGDTPGLKYVTLTATSASFDPNLDNNSACALLEVVEGEAASGQSAQQGF